MLTFRDAMIRELKERFGVRAIAQALEGAGGLTASQRAFQRTSQTRAMLSARGAKILYLEQEEDPDERDKFLDGIFCWNACWLCGV